MHFSSGLACRHESGKAVVNPRLAHLEDLLRTSLALEYWLAYSGHHASARMMEGCSQVLEEKLVRNVGSHSSKNSSTRFYDEKKVSHSGDLHGDLHGGLHGRLHGDLHGGFGIQPMVSEPRSLPLHISGQLHEIGSLPIWETIQPESDAEVVAEVDAGTVAEVVAELITSLDGGANREESESLSFFTSGVDPLCLPTVLTPGGSSNILSMTVSPSANTMPAEPFKSRLPSSSSSVLLLAVADTSPSATAAEPFGSMWAGCEDYHGISVPWAVMFILTSTALMLYQIIWLQISECGVR